MSEAISYEEMTNAQLAKEAEDRGLMVEGEKQKNKPTKADYIKAITEYDVRQQLDIDKANPKGSFEEDDFLNDVIKQVENKPAIDKTKNKEIDTIMLKHWDELTSSERKMLTKKQKKKMQERDYFALRRVMVTSNKDNQTKHEVITSSWGNGLMGYHTDIVILEKPWHVRYGTLKTLKAVKFPRHSVDSHERANVTMVPAYNIQDLGLLSVEEYKRLAEKQKIRNAAAEAGNIE